MLPILEPKILPQTEIPLFPRIPLNNKLEVFPRVPFPRGRENITIDWERILKDIQPEGIPIAEPTPQESIPIDWEEILKSLKPEIFPISEPTPNEVLPPFDITNPELSEILRKPFNMPVGEGGVAKGGEINIEDLPVGGLDQKLLYRGMSIDEFNKGGGGQSKTIAPDEAVRFAQRNAQGFYGDKGGKGVVAVYENGKITKHYLVDAKGNITKLSPTGK